MIYLEDLAKLIGINYKYLKNLIKFKDFYYKTIFIEKRSGDNRQIDTPNYEIKALQTWMLRFVLEKIQINKHVNGFVKGRSINSNAKPHLNKYCIICLDIKNFFNSIVEDEIIAIFNNCLNGIYKNISRELAKICTFKGYLPVGAVTSPFLSNLVFERADEKIIEFCKNRNLCYTRYADDLTFSSEKYLRIEDIEPEISKIIDKYGFKLNSKKSRLNFKGKRMMITGLVLNSGKITVGRKFKRDVRGMIHNYFIKNNKNINLNEMLGKIAFLRGVEPSYFQNNLINYIKKIKSKDINNSI